MKKLFSFLCLLMLGTSMSVWAYTMYTPTKAVLTRIGSTNNFRIELRSNATYAALYVTSVDMGTANALNGTHNITNTNCSNDWFMENDQTRWYQPNGTITFAIVSGSSNADYRYNISVSGYGYQGGCGYIDEGHKGNLTGNWSNVPVEVYESDGTTPIELTDVAAGSGGEEEDDEDKGYYANFKFDTHSIVGSYVNYSNWYAQYDDFVRIIAYDSSLDEKNYCILFFWVTSAYKTTMGGITSPVAGSYQRVAPDRCNSYYGRFWIDQYQYSCPNNIVIGGAKNNYDEYNLNRSYYGSKVNDEITVYAEPYQAIVSQGKDSKPYIRVYDSNNELAVTIGEPIPSYRVSVSSNNVSLGTVNSAGGKYLEGTNSDTYTAENAAGLFEGWYLDGTKVTGNTSEYTITNDGKSIQLLNLQAKHTIEARFIATSGGVITASAPNGSFSGTVTINNVQSNFVSGNNYTGGATVTLTASDDNNDTYMFVAWEDAEHNVVSLNKTYNFTVAGEATYTAIFKRKYQVTATSTNTEYGAVSITPAPVNGYYYEGQSITLNATPATVLCSFVKWQKGAGQDVVGGAQMNIEVSANENYVATFEREEATEIIGRAHHLQFATQNDPWWIYECMVLPDYAFMISMDTSDDTGTFGTSTLYSGSYIIDHGNKYFMTDANVVVTKDATYYYLEGLVTANSKKYYISTYHEIPRSNLGSYANEQGKNYTHSFASVSEVTSLGNGKYVISANDGATGYSDTSYKTELCFIVDPSWGGQGNIPTGRYFVSRGGEAGTVKATTINPDIQDDVYSDNNTYSQVGGSYAKQIYYSSQDIAYSGNMKFWHMQDGYVDVTNVNEHYYIDVHAYNSLYYTMNYTIGSMPVIHTVTATPNNNEWGSVTVPNNGVVLDNGSITLTANESVTGFHFVNWTEVVNDETVTLGTNTQLTLNNVTADRNITANFAQNGYTVTLAKNNDGYGTLTDSEAQVIAEITGVEDNAGISISGNRLTIGSTTVTATAADKSADGIIDYEFVNWTDGDGNALPTMVTADMTIRANFTRFTTLCENCDNGHYTAFKEYNEQTLTAKLFRQFTAGRWSTICLPFDYYQAQMEGHPLKGNINEYLYSEGNATSGGSGLTLYFKSAKSIEAGKPYLVYNTTGDDIVNLTFAGVTIDTDLDTKDADIDYILSKFSYKQSGSISLVGTFRKIKLPEQNHAYMGLMYDETAGKTKIYYPGTNANVPAYRAFFHIDDATPAQQRVRIVVDGVDMGEMLIDNGEIVPTTENLSADRAPRKYIRNGVLVIERNGVTYDAQGKKL